MRKLIQVLALALSALLFAGAPLAQSHQILNVKGKVQVEVPADWGINDAEHRKRVAEFAKTITGKEGVLASLSVASHPQPSKMFVRVSFVKFDDPITQEDVRKEVTANRKQVLDDLASTWAEEGPEMWAALGKRGVREVGKATFDIEPLGGKIALVIKYSRTAPTLPGATMQVTQYHVPIGVEKALITLSVVPGDEDMRRAHDRIKASIKIR